MKKPLYFRGVASLLALVAGVVGTAEAQAAGGKLYMTGSSNPWGQNTEDQAMDVAFGAGNWTKTNGFDASALTAGYSFIYLDGGDGISSEFNSFVSGNLAAIEAYVTGGGHLMMNAARWDQPDLATGFGTQLSAGYSYNGSLTPDGVSAGLGGGGAGVAWTGNYFSHDIVSGLSTCYVVSDAGCTFGSVGNLFVGGQTAPYWQSGGGLQLRANELNLAAGGSAAPEPASWALMMIGFGAIGSAMRSRRGLAVSFG